MIIVIDIGNTNTVIGLYDNDDNLLTHWRVETVENKTVDEYGILIYQFLLYKNIKKDEIKGAIISCVVPPLLPIFYLLCKKYFNIKPILVEPGIKTGMPIMYDNPAEVGADRIVNAVAAYEQYKKGIIVVDFGTATTFDYITPNGEYKGGIIVPGILISLDALFHHAAKLPRIELIKPKRVIGKSTIQAMQSGIYYGYAGMVDAIVEKIKSEIQEKPFVIATGGLAHFIAAASKTIEKVDENLTLKGLLILYKKNVKYQKIHL
ncbi:MAG: type III pantothenate kinase [Deltaproteobacteria bacterium]|nr:type III pantothenate kinase [Deltaproteobacteria bacterium]RLA91376.1 MAG: type III pantothenate kinase [Deltaproteobacteria bacterium]